MQLTGAEIVIECLKEQGVEVGYFTNDNFIESNESDGELVLKQGDTFTATLPKTSGALTITLAFVPNHPPGIERLEVKVDIEGEMSSYINYETYDRSEEWKNNVLRNQALRTIVLPPSSKERTINIQSLTPAIIIDELIVESK